MRLQFVVKAVECFTTIKGLTIKRKQGPIIGYVISKIFQISVIIPKIVAFQASCLHWGHLEKWLIQFLNPLIIGNNRAICDYPNFSTWSDNSSGMTFHCSGNPRCNLQQSC